MSHDFENNDPSDTDSPKSRTAGRLLRDVVRKTLSQSADARQVTEETLRGILGDVKLPRELGNVLFQQADSIKTEVVRVVAGEVRNFLAEANLGEELAKIITSLSFEIRTEIRFIPNDEALRPSVRSKVGVKSQRDNQEPEMVETKETAVMDRAIRNSVTTLANRFMGRIDELLEDVLEPENEHPERDDASDDAFHAEEAAGESTSRKRSTKGPDLRRRAEAAASQVASAGRATASKAAVTAVSAARKPVASVAAKAKANAPVAVAAARSTANAAARSPAVTAAANRAQAVVRGAKPASSATRTEEKETSSTSAKPASRITTTSARPTVATTRASTARTSSPSKSNPTSETAEHSVVLHPPELNDGDDAQPITPPTEPTKD